MIPSGSDSLDVTPGAMLEDTLREVNSMETPPTKAVVIMLWDDEYNYLTASRNAGMKTSEVIALLEVMKARLLKDLVPEDD